MKAISRAALVVVILAFGAGCVGTSGPGMPVPGVVASGTVTVKGRVAMPSAAYHVAEVVEPYGEDDITAIAVFLKRGTEPEVSLGPLADVDTPIQIANLKMGTSYKVRLEAYATVNGEDVRIDAGDVTCVTLLETGNDNLIVDKLFKLKLSKVFLGTAEATVELSSEDVVDADGDVVDVSERQDG